MKVEFRWIELKSNKIALTLQPPITLRDTESWSIDKKQRYVGWNTCTDTERKRVKRSTKRKVMQSKKRKEILRERIKKKVRE